MNQDFLQSIFNTIGRIHIGSISETQLNFLLEQLFYIVSNNIDGDVVEFGCHKGTVSLFIQTLLNSLKSNKMFYVYDSFEGLPDKHMNDKTSDKRFVKGGLKVTQNMFMKNFSSRNIKPPAVYKGWFKDIPDNNIPNKISFAFLDGDFYTSITDSLDKVYSRMNKNGIILIHDYDWPPLPGVKIACNNFFKDKTENIIYQDYMAKIIKN
jgi:O-methyltransferase